MKMISKAEIRKLYAVASNCGLVGRDHDDDLHIIIYNKFKRESVTDLTKKEYIETLDYIYNLTNHSINGMITSKQKKYVMGLMQQLVEINPSSATLEERLARIVHKHLGNTAIPQEPLIWVTKKQAQVLIVILKDYIEYEKKKNERNGYIDKSKSNYP